MDKEWEVASDTKKDQGSNPIFGTSNTTFIFS